MQYMATINATAIKGREGGVLLLLLLLVLRSITAGMDIGQCPMDMPSYRIL